MVSPLELECYTGNADRYIAFICSTTTVFDRRCSSGCSAVADGVAAVADADDVGRVHCRRRRCWASLSWPWWFGCRRRAVRRPTVRSPHRNIFPTDSLLHLLHTHLRDHKLLRMDKEEFFAYRNAAVAAALGTRHMEVAPEQIGAILFLARAGILESAHAARATVVEAERIVGVEIMNYILCRLKKLNPIPLSRHRNGRQSARVMHRQRADHGHVT